MTALFAKLYLDENIAIQLAALLAHRGFCATTARATGLLGATIQLNSHMLRPTDIAS